MESKMKKFHWDILACVFGIVIINIGLRSFIEIQLNEQLSLKILIDVFTITIAGITGKHFSTKVGFPLWWKRNGSVSLQVQITSIILLGLTIIIPNVFIYYTSQ